MSEKEKRILHGQFDISEGEAKEIILQAFESDPTLKIETGRTISDGDLLVNYTNDSDYRKGSKISMCIYWYSFEDVNMISQVYPRKGAKNDSALRIFLNEDLPTTYYTSMPRNWCEIEKGVYSDVEIPNKSVVGGRTRVRGILKDAEKFTGILLLYNKFFKDSKNNLGIDKNRLNIRYIHPFRIEHFLRTKEMLKEINNYERAIVFDNNNAKYLPMYDHDGYIGHQVHM